MILTEIEKKQIKIWRLLKKVSEKHNENYYSIDIGPKTTGLKYYLPRVSHNSFETPEETIESLKKLLKMSTVEYKLDFEGMVKRLAELRKKRKEEAIELEELERAYNDAITKIQKR